MLSLICRSYGAQENVWACFYKHIVPTELNLYIRFSKPPQERLDAKLTPMGRVCEPRQS